MLTRLFKIGCLIVVPLAGETFDQRHQRESAAANPPDLQFRLIAPGTSRPGQRIPITLEFSSSSPDKYRLDAATYDRSGRLPSEEFVAERDDVVDPFQDYFGTGVLGSIMGGGRTRPVLDSTASRIELVLNDWFRFDHPGRYRLY